MKIRFSIPGDPQGWARTRTNNGSHFTAPPTRGYQNTIRWMAKAAGAKVLDGPLGIEITAHYRIPASATKSRREAMLHGDDYPTKKPDIDNVVKNVLDALNKLAWNDDAQVVSLSVLKLWSDEPRVDVDVFPHTKREIQRRAA